MSMREKPILMSGEMVRALLNGTKSQTRRAVKPQPERVTFPDSDVVGWRFRCRARHGEYVSVPDGFSGFSQLLHDHVSRYQVGDRLWVRETWAVSCAYDYCSATDPHIYAVAYKAGGARPDGYDFEEGRERGRWRSARFMPRWAARLFLEVCDVRVERLQEISEEDAKAEGIRQFTKDNSVYKYWPCDPCEGYLKAAWQDLSRDPREAYRVLWDSLNGKSYPWESSPWVWVIEFKRVQP